MRCILVIGAVVALVAWLLYITPVFDIILKIGFFILIALVVCTILGAAGINPFKSEQGKL